MSANCSFVCPPLTELNHDGTKYTCQFEEWAYGLAATLLCFGGLLPIGLVIWFWVKLKNASLSPKRKLHRQDSEASTFTDVSRPHDHGVYEVIRNDDAHDVLFRTSKGGFLRHKYGTFSVPDLKTFEKYASSSKHLYPDLTQVHSPESLPTTPTKTIKHIGSVSASSRFSSEEGIPSRLARKRRKERSYEDVKVNQPKSVKFRGQKRKLARDSRISSKTEFRNANRIKHGNRKADRDDESSSLSSSAEGISMDKGKRTPIRQLDYERPGSSSDYQADSGSNCLSFLPTPPLKHLAEGMDFDVYLKDCVVKLPEDQRNGTFLIRDSQSNRGCKVLVVYCRGSQPGNVLNHYKLRFFEDGRVYIQGVNEVFSGINALVDFYRERRTVLPCLLSNCLGKNF